MVAARARLGQTAIAADCPNVPDRKRIFVHSWTLSSECHSPWSKNFWVPGRVVGKTELIRTVTARVLSHLARHRDYTHRPIKTCDGCSQQSRGMQ
jgi:hypothetical protein